MTARPWNQSEVQPGSQEGRSTTKLCSIFSGCPGRVAPASVGDGGAPLTSTLEAPMTYQAFMSVIAASIGLVSGWWFCAGAILVTPERIAKAADDSWDADPGIDEALTSQSAEYLAGGIALAVAFCFQIAAALADTTNFQAPYPILLRAWFLVPTTVVLSYLASYPVYVLRKTSLKNRLPKSQPEKQ